MGEFLEYGDVYQEIRGTMNSGKLKLASNNVVFKNLKTGMVDQYASSEIEETQWLIRSRGHCLKIIMTNGNVHRYDGFKESDYEKLSSYLQKHYSVSLTKKDLSVRGWNWGISNFYGNTLEFDVENQIAFEIPLVNVSRSLTSKNEVTIEFTPNDDASVSLVEMRFHVPADSTPEGDAVEEFHRKVMAKAEVIQVTGDAITSFSEVSCLTPRGRYDIKIYPSFLELHGKSFDYKITFSSILRLFLLPHKDGRQMFFVVSLDPPIKQGQTRYHFLILLFIKETETTLELTLSDEDLEKKYDGKLSKEMSGPEYEVFSRLMKTLLNKKITVPGVFVGHSGAQCIGCSYKAATGFLYPLERGFIFMHKPPIHIRFDEVESVNFARSAGSTRSFDFDIDTKAGTTYTFVGVEKDEYGKLYDFVSEKKLRVKNIGGKLDSKPAVSYLEDMMPSDDEDQGDAYLKRVKAEGMAMGHEGGDDDDDDDESDEDFNPDNFKPDGSASEPDDEYDSNPESTPDNSSAEDNVPKGSEDSGSEDGSDSKPLKTTSKPKPEKDKKDKPRKSKSETKPKRTKKKEVDADKPKRAQSAYFLWLNEIRSSIKEEFPGISITDLSRKAGERWKEVKDKSKWEALASKEKTAYESAMSEWKKKERSRPSDSPPSSPKSKKPKKTVAAVKETSAGSGGAYKSKEFISDHEGSSSEAASEKTPPRKKPSRRGKKGGSSSESEVGELPDEEDILSTPTSSGKGSVASASESAASSDSDSD